MAMEYPLHLKRGTKINVEGRNYTVHSRDFFEKDRVGVFHNKVGIETTVGTFFLVPISQQVETGFVHTRKQKVVERERY